jgi:hypothetical protein
VQVHSFVANLPGGKPDDMDTTFTCQDATRQAGQVGMDSRRVVPTVPGAGEDANQSAIFPEEYR